VPLEILHRAAPCRNVPVTFTLCLMKLSADARQRWVVAAGFAGFIALSLAVSYLLGLLPSFEEKCAQECKPQGLEGHMVAKYPWTMTGSKKGPEECKCFAPGSYGRRW
jgi:hypothetical protein